MQTSQKAHLPWHEAWLESAASAWSAEGLPMQAPNLSPCLEHVGLYCHAWPVRTDCMQRGPPLAEANSSALCAKVQASPF